jgi:hypothetical protein
MNHQRLAPIGKKWTIGGQTIRWLLRDEFTTDLNPGSVNGTAAEPGPGTRLVYADSTNLLGLSSGATVPWAGAPATGDPGLSYPAITRVAGLPLFVALKYSTLSGVRYQFGWGTINNPAATGMEQFMTDYAGVYGGRSFMLSPCDAPGDTIWFAVILRSVGGYYFYKSIDGIWKLAQMETASSASTVYPFFDTRTSINIPITSIRVPRYYWLPVPLVSDSFNRGNGAIGSTDGSGHAETSGLGSGGKDIIWIGPSWMISANKAVNTPATVGSNLIVNGTFDNWTGDNPDNWTVVGETGPATAEITERDPAQGHAGGGTGACNIFSTLSYVYLHQPVLTAGKWYTISIPVTNVVSGQMNFSGLHQVSGTSVIAAGQTIVYRGIAVSQSPQSVFISRQGGATDITIDGVTATELDINSLICVSDTGNANVVAMVDMTLTNPGVGSDSPAGLILCANATVSPTNYILVYVCFNAGTFRIFVIKVVNGVCTVVSVTAPTYTAGRTLFVIKDGSWLSAYYNGGILGTLSTISDPELINNTIHGMFSTHASNAMDNFVVYPRGNSGEYSILNAFSQPANDINFIPFADPFSAGTTLGSRWTGSTWSISAGKALNTPVTGVADNVSNGTFTDATGWSLGSGWSVGTGTLNASSPSNNSTCNNTGGVNSVARTWYHIELDLVSLVRVGNAILGASADSCNGLFSVGTTPGNHYIGTYMSNIVGKPSVKSMNATGSMTSASIDNFVVKQLDWSKVFATVQTDQSNVSVSANVTLDATGLVTSGAGVVACLDSTVSPLNFLFAYVTSFQEPAGTTNLYFFKCVNGITTTLVGQSISSSYVAGAPVKIVKNGNYAAVYYNGIQIGTTQIVNDAGIINNTRHGMFSNYSGNTLDNFMVTGAPFIFLDQFTGAFDSLWTNKSTWTISSDKAIATPVTFTPRTVINGDFTNWTGDNPDNWTVANEDANNYITEDAGKLRIVSDNSKLVSATSQVVSGAVLGKWARISFDLIFVSGVIGVGTSVGMNLGTGNYGVTGTKYYNCRITGNPQMIVIRGTACDADVDNFTFNEMVLSELIKTIVTDRSDVAVAVEITPGTLAVASPMGVIACLNSESSPTSFILGYIGWRSGIYGAYLDKCVNGTYTQLASANITAVANGAIKLVKSGTSVSLYYNNIQVGTTQTVSDTEIISNTIHGMFSAYPDNLLNNFSIG